MVVTPKTSNLSGKTPCRILMSGLQGSGKTNLSGKNWPINLQQKE